MPRKRAKGLMLQDCIYCSDGSALEEVIALTQENVLGQTIASHGEELQYNVDQFLIHTSHSLCCLEDGLVDKGVQVFVCGLLCKLIPEDGNRVSVPVRQIGPISEWWFAGFDGGCSLLVGIQSPYATYHLQVAHPTYCALFERLRRKMYITKCFIECISDNPQHSLQQLFTSVKDKFPAFDYELLLASVDFIVRQIANYDRFSSANEIQLSDTVAFESLAKLTGASVMVSNFEHSNTNGMTRCFKKKNNFIKQVNTPMSESIFNSIYCDLLENANNSEISSLSVDNKPSSGLFVQFRLGDKLLYGRICEKKQDKLHINILCHGKETLLGEAAPKNCLFVTTECADVYYKSVISSIELRSGLLSETLQEWSSMSCFDCSMSFCSQSCSFQSLPPDYFERSSSTCLGCIRKRSILPRLVYSQNGDYEVHYKQMVIRVGDCVLFQAELDMPLFDYFHDDTDSIETVDCQLYPEKYRKKFSKDSRKNYYDLSDLSQCCKIGQVNRISLSGETIQLSLNHFYRPQNVYSNYCDFIRSDLNCLFWTESTISLPASVVIRKCDVFYCPSFYSDTYIHSESFYFSLCYDCDKVILYEPSEKLKLTFASHTKTDGELVPKNGLNILDLFSGCGGMSYGFKQAAAHIYAIDNDKSASDSFKANFANCTVLNSDVNVILNSMITAEDVFVGTAFPDKHSIDIIIGGPPCQGFSEMNRFSTSEYSQFKSSMMSSYLNFVEYYRPKYLLLENVRSLASYKKSSVLKIVCSFLIRLRYQLRVAVLQAGSYGLPQNRRRIFIIGSAAGLELPLFPCPTHAFSQKHCDTSFKIDSKKYDPMKAKNVLFRMVTVEDAIGDLPQLLQEDYFKSHPRKYASEDKLCHYQRVMRTNCGLFVSEHACKEMTALDSERISHIPLLPNSDWRDLPNIEVQLADGWIARKLQYNFEDIRNGSWAAGVKRGVCSCAQGRQCEAALWRQEKTLIPWCLVHTGNRHNHWPGLYGRLCLKGFFSTTVTKPDPISFQGRVIHPEQNRLLSVREFARSQGFPDDFRLCGDIDDKYRLIGNAVPPILSVAIARQFIRTIDDQP